MTASTADSYQARLRLRSQSNVCKCSPFLLLSPLCPGHSHTDPILNHSQSLNHTSWIQALALWPFSTWSGHSLLPGAFRGLYSFSLSIDFFSPLLPVSPQAMEPFCSPHMSTPALHMLVPLPRVPFLTSLPELLLIRQEPLPLRRLPQRPPERGICSLLHALSVLTRILTPGLLSFNFHLLVSSPICKFLWVWSIIQLPILASIAGTQKKRVDVQGKSYWELSKSLENPGAIAWGNSQVAWW